MTVTPSRTTVTGAVTHPAHRAPGLRLAPPARAAPGQPHSGRDGPPRPARRELEGTLVGPGPARADSEAAAAPGAQPEATTSNFKLKHRVTVTVPVSRSMAHWHRDCSLTRRPGVAAPAPRGRLDVRLLI